MRGSENAYSRAIGLAKIALPLVALGLLSSLFLVARDIDPAQAIPYAGVDARKMARDERIGAPSYTGVTRDGTAIRLTAETASPQPEAAGKIGAKGIRADLETPGKERTTILAAHALIDTDARRATLSGDVRITTSSGFRMTTEELTTSLDRTDVQTGSVTATGPPGRLQAGRMRMGGKTGRQHLLFDEGVELVSAPQQ